jgi:hypothetical protein
METRDVPAGLAGSLTYAPGEFSDFFTQVGRPAAVQFLVTDPIAVSTATIDWGDGTAVDHINVALGLNVLVTATHTYASPNPVGVAYPVTVTDTDFFGNQLGPLYFFGIVDPAPPAPPTPPPVQTPLQLGVFVEVAKVKGRYEADVFSATTGSLLFRLSPFPKSVRHQPQIEFRDLNGDGVPDWLITAQQGKQTLSLAMNGVNGVPLF